METTPPFVHSTISKSMTSAYLSDGQTLLSIANGYLCLEVIKDKQVIERRHFAAEELIGLQIGEVLRQASTPDVSQVSQG